MTDKTVTWQNTYTMIAAGMRLASYRVRDPFMSEDDWSELQHHLTYNNVIQGILSNTALMCLKNFIDDLDVKKISTETYGNVRIVYFNETQKDGSDWWVIHVYQNDMIYARLGLELARVFCTALGES